LIYYLKTKDCQIFPFKLKNTLASNVPAEGEDVLAAKTALGRLGRYKPLVGGINPWPDQGMIDGLKGFQKDRGLKADGVAHPGGPTEAALNAAVAEQEAPGTARRQVFGLAQPIGRGRANRPGDVAGARRALGLAGYAPRESAGKSAGENAGENTGTRRGAARVGENGNNGNRGRDGGAAGRFSEPVLMNSEECGFMEELILEGGRFAK
jgi:hypothetical protein